MRAGRFLCLFTIGLLAWPLTPHAAPENTLQRLLDTSFAINIGSQPAESQHPNLIAAPSSNVSFGESSSNSSPNDYLQVAFDYLNKKLGLTPQDVSLKPMVGIDIFQTFTLAEGITFTPEVYAIYRHEAIDDNLPLFVHHSLQTGLGLAMNIADSVSAHFSVDSDLLTGHEQRAALMMKYRW